MTQASHPRVLAADPDGIAQATAVLEQGGLVAVPTETVYGLAARADRDESVAAIYRAKGRPSFNPLIVHVADLDQARALAQFDSVSERLAERFWPGPLTLVLPLRDGACVAPAVTAGLVTVALRCPAHPAMAAVLRACDFPIAAPSANRSGAISPTTAEHVAASLGGKVDLILDAGPCLAGVESTILAVREGGEWEILRPGPITREVLEEVIGSPPSRSANDTIEAPGQLASHYAPGKPMRLGAIESEADEFLIGFGSVVGEFQLSSQGDLTDAASRLYAALYAGAASPRPRIAVAPIPNEGIGVAINDRLRRAAA